MVVLGPSGSGKTTLLNQIGALEAPSAGEVEANGFNLNGLGDEGRTIIVSSHVLQEVERMSERVIAIVDGKLVIKLESVFMKATDYSALK